MSNPEEIEVEVVEVGESRTISRPNPHQEKTADTAKRRPTSSFPFGGMSARTIRLPGWLWPIAILLGLILLLLALVVGLILAIPFLIIRAILRLLMPAAR